LKFDQPLIPGKLIKRYKRFLADVELDSGEIITAHCPNTGSMKTCDTPGWKVMLSYHENPKRIIEDEEVISKILKHSQPFLLYHIPKAPYIGPHFFLTYQADSTIFFLRKSNVLSLATRGAKAHFKRFRRRRHNAQFIFCKEFEAVSSKHIF
jgi:hypothetical protein